jgi:hypothetical protein
LKVTRKDIRATKCADFSYGSQKKLTGDKVREVENVGERMPVEYLLRTIDNRSGKGDGVFE